MCIMDLVGHGVTPFHPELVMFDIAAERIVFGGHCLVFKDTGPLETIKNNYKNMRANIFSNMNNLFVSKNLHFPLSFPL